MSMWSRIVNAVRGGQLSREINEELASHVAETIEHGRDAAEARTAFGSALRYSEESRDVRLVAWLNGLRADAVFGWRQLMKKKATSAAAILSLALAIGACTGAFTWRTLQRTPRRRTGTQPNASQPNAPRVAPCESGASTAGSQGRSLSTMRLVKVAPRSYDTAMVKSTSRSPPGVLGP